MAKDKDKDRDEAEDRNEAEDRDESDEAEEEESDDGEDEGDEPKAAAGKDDDEDEDESDDDEDDDEDDERHASTSGVAKALGVDGEEEEGEASAKEEPAAAPNRAARRREDALKKRRARTGGDKKTSDDEDADEAVSAKEPLPKDKNLRAKELLKRRQEAAASRQSSTAVGLSAGEMVQDSLARAGGSATKFLRSHWKKLGVAIVAGVAGTAGLLYFLENRQESTGKVTDALSKAVMMENAPVLAEDKRPEEQKAADPTPVFPTGEAKAEAVLAAYTKVVDEHKGTGAAILAKFGQAGAYLDKNQADQAFSAYEEILRTELAKADVDVRARAIEGKGFALESKKDFDGAMNVFKELEGVDKVYADLAKYHQARMLLAKGEKDKAKEIFLALKKTLEVPTLEGPQAPHLRQMVEETLHSIDPSIPRPKRQMGGPKGTLSADEIEELRRKFEEMQKQQGEGHGDDAH
ncbi:MAG: hypothetical protein HOV80_11775 [Polyangiaceae bacterium]|nr:hypothetical protein [Polyangiaceae bacterium]